MQLVREAVVVALGGGCGAVARYFVTQLSHHLLGRAFPWGTLTVNVLGSLVLGVAYVVVMERLGGAGLWRGAIIVGFLGAFTTFSTFSLDTVLLLEQGHGLRAMVNVVANVVACVVLAWVGVAVARQLMAA